MLHLDDNDGSSEAPLGMACRLEDAQIGSLLLEAGACKEQGLVTKHDDCLTPLAAACTNGHVSVVRMLLEAGADKDGPHAEVDRLVTPLCAAAAEGHTEVVRLLMEANTQEGSLQHDTV